MSIKIIKNNVIERADPIKEFISDDIYIIYGDLGFSKKGFGIFAKRDFQKGEKILSFSGKKITFKQAKLKGEWECMALQIDNLSYHKKIYLDLDLPSCYANHSCDPNAGIQNDVDLVAIKKVHKGEEIRYDYSTTMDERSFKMRCECGSPSCRRIVGDFIELNVNLRNAYLENKIVMKFILKKYK